MSRADNKIDSIIKFCLGYELNEMKIIKKLLKLAIIRQKIKLSLYMLSQT